MRTGAIFARGSCRALTWMALVGTVLALGAGRVAAQITVAEPPTTLTEGEATTITVEFVGDIPAESAVSEVILRATATNATVSGGLMTVPLPANSSTTEVAAFAKATRTFTVTADQDADADESNNGDVVVTFAVVLPAGTLVDTGTTNAVGPPTALTLGVEEDDVQGYTLELVTRDENLEEGKPIEYRVKAAPAFLVGASAVDVDLRLTPKVSTFSGTGVTSTVKGEGMVSIGPGDDGTRTISFMVPKDEDTDDTQIVLTALWGTRLEPGEISDSRTIMDPDQPTGPTPGAVTFTTTQADIPATVGTAVSQTLPMATGGTGAIAYTTTTLPAGLTFAPSTRMLTGTPTAAGTTTVTYTATDSATPTPAMGTLTFDIIVTSTSTPPPTTAAEGTYALSASASMTEGQSLVPVEVTYQVPAARSGIRSGVVTVVVSVTQPTDAEIVASQGAAIAVLESMQPPVTRAELGSGVGTAGQVIDLNAAGSDVEWMPNTVGDVRIDNATGMASFVFDYGEDAFNKTHTAYLRTHRDSDDAEDELFHLEATTAHSGVTRAARNKDVVVKIDDVQTQAYEVDFPGNNSDEIDEGESAGLEVVAVPDRTVDIPFNVTLSAVKDVTDYSLDSNPAAISQNYTLSAGQTQAFTINTKTVDGDREDDTVTALVQTMNQPGTQRPLVVPSFELDVVDLHKLPKITLTKIQVPDADDKLQDATAIPEGKIGTVTLTADRSPDDVPDSEAITVTLSHSDDSTADTRDYTLGSEEVKFTATGLTATFKVDVDADEDVRGESLVLLATVEGAKANGPNPDDPYNLAAIPFGDETVKQIEAKSYAEIEAARDTARTAGAGANGLWEPGETLTLEASDLFEFADTASVVLGNIVVDDPAILSAVTSNDAVTVTAVGDGESPISITATVLPASSLEVTQTTSTVATIKFPISVDAPMITAKDNVQAVANAAVAKAAEASANGIWEPAPNGAVAMVAVSDLFDVPASINDEYLARSSDTADVTAAISSDMMNVELTPKGAGMATITVTAVDSDRPGSAVTIDFTVEVMAQASLRAKSQDEVDKVFVDAGAGALVAGGDAVMVDMSMLYEIADEVKPTYTATSDMPKVLEVSASGMMLTLTPMSAGDAMVMVEAVDSASKSIVAVMYDATVDRAETTYMLTASEMSVMEGGDAVTITATAKQEVLAETMIELQYAGTSASEDDYSLEPKMITIAAGGTVGTTMLTATDDDEVEGMESLTLNAVIESMIVDSLTLEVGDNDMEVTYTLSSEDEHIVEGDMDHANGTKAAATLTATASSAVLVDTEVMIMRDGASTASADDYSAESITIEAGDTTGTTMVMALEDNEPDSDSGSPEMLTLYGMVDGMQTNSVSFYLWDAAVPALPVIAQLLLAAFLAIGGYRRYLRR